MQGISLRRVGLFAAIVAAAGGSGCSTMNNTERDAVGGGVIGTAGGAAIGALTGKPLLGAAIGGLAGTAGGALIGNEADKEDQRRRDAFQNQQLAIAQANAQRMGIADVIRLSREGQNPQIIINQIRATRSTFQLTVSDLEMLKNSGVSDAVIAEMQNSPPGSVIVPNANPTVVYDASGVPVVVRPAPVVVVGGPPPRYYYRGGYYYRW